MKHIAKGIAASAGWVSSTCSFFAVIMTVAMEMAIITPPVGMNLYVIQGLMAS